jgi:muramoyltetrapeptide carboxypeptidase
LKALLKPSARRVGCGHQHRRPGIFGKARARRARLAALRSLGYAPRGQRLLREPLYFAGTPQQRLADLHAAFADPDTAAVMCLRGGYGSNYLLDGLDLDLIRASQAVLRLQRPHRHSAPPARPAWPARVSRPHARRRFLSLEDGVHLPSFRAALAGEPYSVGAAEGLRTSSPPRLQPRARHALWRLPQHSGFAARHALGAADRRQAALS